VAQLAEAPRHHNKIKLSLESQPTLGSQIDQMWTIVFPDAGSSPVLASKSWPAEW